MTGSLMLALALAVLALVTTNSEGIPESGKKYTKSTTRADKGAFAKVIQLLDAMTEHLTEPSSTVDPVTPGTVENKTETEVFTTEDPLATKLPSSLQKTVDNADKGLGFKDVVSMLAPLYLLLRQQILLSKQQNDLLQEPSVIAIKKLNVKNVNRDERNSAIDPVVKMVRSMPGRVKVDIDMVNVENTDDKPQEKTLPWNGVTDQKLVNMFKQTLNKFSELAVDKE